ncbi:MAG: hypothetical protein WA210_00860 [Burkholderiaceae bacterium]
MPKPLDTRKIADIATHIERLRAEIATKEAELARLCGLPAPEAAEPRARKPRRSRTNVEVLGAGMTARDLTPEEIAERDKTTLRPSTAEEMARHDPDRTDPAQPADGLTDLPDFLRRGGTMTEAEKLAAAEKALQS